MALEGLYTMYNLILLDFYEILECFDNWCVGSHWHAK